MIKLLSIDSKLQIQIQLEQKPVFSTAVQSEVDSIWEVEERKRVGKSALFDGPILSLLEFNESVLRAQITTYRYFLAQLRKPSLHQELKVKPLAVSGFVRHQKHIVFGKRSLTMTQDAGMWELAPSGSLDAKSILDNTVNAEAQLWVELEEELGISRAIVLTSAPIFLIEDLTSFVVDIVFDVKLKDELLWAQIQNQKRSSEYSEVRWVEESKISTFCSDESLRKVSPTSIEILKSKKLI